MRTGSNRHFHTAFELRDWGHMQTACDFLSLNGYKLLWGPGRHGIGHNLFCLSPRAERADHRAVRRARPDERGSRLFRAAALAPRPAAAAEGLGQGPERVELLGHHADGRNAQVKSGDCTTRRRATTLRPQGGNDDEAALGMRCAHVAAALIVRSALAVRRVRAERQSDQDRRQPGADRRGRRAQQGHSDRAGNLARRRQRQGRPARPSGRSSSSTTTRARRRTCRTSTPS